MVSTRFSYACLSADEYVPAYAAPPDGIHGLAEEVGILVSTVEMSATVANDIGNAQLFEGWGTKPCGAVFAKLPTSLLRINVAEPTDIRLKLVIFLKEVGLLLKQWTARLPEFQNWDRHVKSFVRGDSVSASVALQLA